MTDPVRERQLQELDTVGICTRIFYQARSELYVNMHFLDIPLSSLGFEADWGRNGLAVDGAVIFYGPDALLEFYRKGRTVVNRAYLHMVFHCLFCHMYTRKGRDKTLWDLSCDIAMEALIDGLYQKCVHVPQSPLRRETYLRLKRYMEEGEHTSGGSGSVLTAECIFRALAHMELPARRLDQLRAEFKVDDHDLWEQEEDPRQAVTRQNQWNDNREKMQTQMETMGSKDESRGDEGLKDMLRVENRERYDYRQFLRRFSVLKEEIEVDPDSFDPIFYTYGMSLYGNMPLMEPLESREVFRIEDFVIVIDTSMSCSGELVRRFLEETYDVLSESETYFRKIRIHILQCDDRVQADVVIESAEDLKAYMDRFQVTGFGGTDFRPAFEYVNELRAKGETDRLRGLIYFTDGKGIYPVQAPPYDTAFVFIEDMFSDASVPAWAMKIVLEEEQLMEIPGVFSDRKKDEE